MNLRRQSTADINKAMEVNNQLEFFNTFKCQVFAPMGRFQLELIYLYFHRPSI